MHGGGPGFESPRLHRGGWETSSAADSPPIRHHQLRWDDRTRRESSAETPGRKGQGVRQRFHDLVRDDLRVVACTLTMRHAEPVRFCGRGNRHLLRGVCDRALLWSRQRERQRGARVWSPARTANQYINDYCWFCPLPPGRHRWWRREWRGWDWGHPSEARAEAAGRREAGRDTSRWRVPVCCRGHDVCWMGIKRKTPHDGRMVDALALAAEEGRGHAAKCPGEALAA